MDLVTDQGAEALIDTLKGLAENRLIPQPQDERQACYAAKLDKAEAELDWTQRAEELSYKVRAFNPWPVSQTHYAGKALRIWEATVLPGSQVHEPGKVIATSRQGIDVATGEGVLRMLSVQLPGGKRISASEFLNAHRIDNIRLPS